MASYVKSLGSFTGTGNGAAGRMAKARTHGGTFIVGTNVAGAAGVIAIDGSPNGDATTPDWYPIFTFAGTPAAATVTVATGNIAQTVIQGEHAWIRARCTTFTSGVIPAWFVAGSEA